MTNQDPKDHWADLASELGAEPPSDVQGPPTREPQPPEASAPDDESTAAPGRSAAPPPSTRSRPETQRAKAAPLPPRPAAHWDLLASELGLEPAPISAAEVVREPLIPSQIVPPPDEPREVISQTAAGWEEPIELPEESIVRGADRREGFGGAASTAEDREREEPHERDGRGGEPREGEPEKTRTSRRRRRRRRKGRGSGEGEARPAGATEDRPRGEALEPVEAAPAESPSSETTAGAPAEPAAPEASEPGRGKRRRQRRPARKKSRKVVSEAAGDEPPDNEELVETGAARRPRQSERAEPSPDALAGEAASLEDQEPDGDAQDSRSLHHGIPTWEEAVGMIIGNNMESRAKRPNGSGSRGRGGSHGSRESQRGK